MTKAAQQLLSVFSTLPPKAQKEVLVSLLRLPIEVPYTAPTDEQLRRVADAVFLELDRREAVT
jgi:hypothetical protein